MTKVNGWGTIKLPASLRSEDCSYSDWKPRSHSRWKACSPSPESPPAEALVDSVVRDGLLSTGAREDERNLKFVGDRLTQGDSNLRLVLKTYRDVLRGKQIRDIPASPVHTSLRLSGVVKPDQERNLRVRNRVYQDVFNEPWVREKTPRDTAKLVAAAALVLLAISATWYLFVFPKAYIQALESASEDVEVAYQAYESLNKPLHREKASDLLAQFFERRSDRDSAILVRGKASDGSKLADLVGTDYPSLHRTLRHQGRVNSVAFSADGKQVATGSHDQTARVFDAATGRELSRLVHQGPVRSVAFSADGKQVATGSMDGTARVFEAATGREVSRLTHQGVAIQGVVRSVVFSADGKQVATGSEDGTARVFEAATGREVSRLAHQG